LACPTHHQNSEQASRPYVPFETETTPGQVIPGRTKCGGAILSFDPDSPNPEETLEVYAWGFRNVVGIAWNQSTGEMYAAVNGYDGRARLSPSPG
jgi:glucose/arabinose dehydrogenase